MKYKRDKEKEKCTRYFYTSSFDEETTSNSQSTKLSSNKQTNA